MFRRMLKSALDVGFRAAYVLGDAWFGCKENIRASLDLGLVAIFQMKRGNMNYWSLKRRNRTLACSPNRVAPISMPMPRCIWLRCDTL